MGRPWSAWARQPRRPIWGLDETGVSARRTIRGRSTDGELLLGLKIENTRALANAEKVAAVPGIAFAEWGPGDMGMSLGLPDAHDPPYPPEMVAARNKVLAACKAKQVAFLEQVTPENVVEQIAARRLVGARQEPTPPRPRIGRRHTSARSPGRRAKPAPSGKSAIWESPDW